MKEIKTMSAIEWTEWIADLRKEAEANGESDNQTLSRHLILWAARRLKAEEATMTAQTMVLMLNEIDQFRQSGWLYSPATRGPCASVRGAYNEYANKGDQASATLIAGAFTNLQGEYAYEV